MYPTLLSDEANRVPRLEVRQNPTRPRRRLLSSAPARSSSTNWPELGTSGPHARDGIELDFVLDVEKGSEAR